MAFWLSPEENAVRRAIANARRKRRQNQYDEVTDLAEDLIRNYDDVIEARTKFRKACTDLEKLQADVKVAEALGRKPPSLTSVQKEVDTAKAILEAYEGQLYVAERRAKQRYPKTFRFL